MDEVWLCRGPFEGARHERLQLELYIVAMMLQTVRAYAGPGWRSRELWLQAAAGSGVEERAELCAENVRLGRPLLALPIARALLRRPHLSARRARPSMTATTGSQAVDGILGSIRQVIRTYHPCGGTSLQLIAEAGGLSKRSLQRQLAFLGTRLSALVQRERMQAAEELLSETDLHLADIATEIGYTDPAHFTRAFRHWFGVAPSALRSERTRSQARH